MPLDTKQREALRLEFLLKANECDKWINDHYRKLDADLKRVVAPFEREWLDLQRSWRCRAE